MGESVVGWMYESWFTVHILLTPSCTSFRINVAGAYSECNLSLEFDFSYIIVKLASE